MGSLHAYKKHYLQYVSGIGCDQVHAVGMCAVSRRMTTTTCVAANTRVKSPNETSLYNQSSCFRQQTA